MFQKQQFPDVSIDELVTGEKKEVKNDPVPMQNLIEVSLNVTPLQDITTLPTGDTTIYYYAVSVIF